MGSALQECVLGLDRLPDQAEWLRDQLARARYLRNPAHAFDALCFNSWDEFRRGGA